MRGFSHIGWVSAALALMACEPTPPPTPAAAPIEAHAPARVRAPSPGQDEPTPASPADITAALLEGGVGGGLRGGVVDLESSIMHLVLGVTDTLEQQLPDAEAAITAVEAYVKAHREESERLGAQLVALELEDDTLRDWKGRVSDRFRADLKAYELAVARFELAASDEQILRFNAAMKTLAAPMRD